MRLGKTIGTILLAGTLVWLGARPAPGQPRGARKPTPRTVLKMEREYLVPVTGDAAPLPAGAKVDVHFLNGKCSEGLEIAEVHAGRDGRALQSITLKSPAGKSQRVQAAALSRLVVGDKASYEVLLDADTKAYVLLDLARRDQVVAERLKRHGYQLWTDLSEADQAAAVTADKEYLKRVAAAFPQRAFIRKETERFLFLSDIPANQMSGYVASLDSMYTELCQLFGIPPQTNVWRGKCMVIAFLDQQEFARYASESHQDSDTGSRAGKCYGHADGRVIIACHRGDNPAFFGAMLVHETAHGFVHRFRSNAAIPTWLNEGIADWVAGVVVPASTTTVRRQKEAVKQMATSGTMLDLFQAQGAAFQGPHYGIASSLTHYMIQHEPTRYRALLTAVKEGVDWTAALQEMYGVTPEELTLAYGRSLGIMNLRP
jgi:hypothetical protein